MVLTRSFARNNNILLDVEEPNPVNQSFPLSSSSPNNLTQNGDIVINSDQNSASVNMNNQHFNFPNVNNTPSLKLPQFWTSCPAAWFIQIEMLFDINQIRDDVRKYQYVTVALSQEVVTKILDILQAPPANNKYEFIKKVLCERFSLSEERRLEQLFSDREIGDRKPSEFYRDMVNIAGSLSMIGNELIYKLWVRKLPAELQIHLTSSNLDNIEDKLNLADKVWDVIHQNRVASINQTGCSNTSREVLQSFSMVTGQICEMMDKLRLEISELRSPRSNYRGERNFRRSSRSRSRRQYDQCWYHFKFGSNAHKCIPPCNFVAHGQNSDNLN